MKLVVKRNGYNQVFDIKKLYASVYSSCLAIHHQIEQAELIADSVSKNVAEEIQSEEIVKSEEISKLTYKHLLNYDEDAAFLYHSHRNIS